MDPTQQDDGFDRQWFNYVADITVGANATVPYMMQILADADFEWWWTSASRTSGLLKILMIEQGTGRQFIGTTASSISGAGVFAGINIDNWCGLASASAAFPIAVPFVMPATRTYQLTLADSSGAQNVVEINFSGFKLWNRSTANSAAGLPSQAGSTAAPGNANPGQMSGWR